MKKENIVDIITLKKYKLWYIPQFVQALKPLHSPR